ncbi:MAG TPA: FAD-dependent oxidoreductase [Candidatus Cybelea sp.]|nr:FAD-dependent oxidoreductase [Candidatus Cybelea sp.]
MNTRTEAPVVVVGAGIVGMAAASFLQRDGRKVVVLDPGAPGEGASYGNAGCLNGSSVVPVSMPGTLSKVPGWLLDPEGPLTIRLRYLPVLLPWLWRFVRAGTPEKVAAQARALRPLIAPSVETYRQLARDAGAEDLIHRAGHLMAYRSDASFAGDAGANRLRSDNGVEIQELGADELRQLEPALSRDYVRGRLITENGHCANPLRLVQSLAEMFVRRGGIIRRERVRDFAFDGVSVAEVFTDAGRQAASQVVLAAGAWSRPLAAKLGDRVPLDTERGYHVMLKDPEVCPRIPTLSGEGKFVATPMEEGLRFAGTVEFAGLDAPPDWRRARVLLRQGQQMYPGLARQIDEGRIKQWMGFRPSMPDSLPVIGTARAHPNALYAFGHGHIGLVAGAMTGRVIADLAAGRPPAIDVTPFDVRRFA